jgi:hypothetical protein
LASLSIIVLLLAWDRSGGAADGPKPADPGPPDAKKGEDADFAFPITSVNAFLAALKVQALDRLADATSLYAPSEAMGKNQKLFQAILDQSLGKEELATLAREFDGYKIVGLAGRGGGRRVLVVCEKKGANGAVFGRIITARREKAGWKVLDFSSERRVPPVGAHAR